MLSALGQGGTSFDALYVNVNGQSGYFDRSLEVYGREARALHPLRYADPADHLHEPFVLLLPGLSACSTPAPYALTAPRRRRRSPARRRT